MENEFCVVGDIHGNLKAWKQVLEDKEANPGMKIYLLGDLCDRGNDGYRIMKEALKCVGPDFCYLKGNHEDMFVKAAKQIARLMDMEGITAERKSHTRGQARSLARYYGAINEDILLHIANGGEVTLADWITDGCPFDVLMKLEKLPLTASYSSHGLTFDMCHAGCLREQWEDQSKEEPFLWSREHFKEDWFPDHILIHGHTPCKYLSGLLEMEDEEYERKENGFIFYKNKRKIDIDTSGGEFDLLILGE